LEKFSFLIDQNNSFAVSAPAGLLTEPGGPGQETGLSNFAINFLYSLFSFFMEIIYK